MMLMACLVADRGAQAADKAATTARPAALRALGIPESQVMTHQEAHQVRGQKTLDYWVGGVVLVHNNLGTAVVPISSYNPYVVRVVLMPWFASIAVESQ
jgi:hypothetical protein